MARKTKRKAAPSSRRQPRKTSAPACPDARLLNPIPPASKAAGQLLQGASDFAELDLTALDDQDRKLALALLTMTTKSLARSVGPLVSLAIFADDDIEHRAGARFIYELTRFLHACVPGADDGEEVTP